MHNYLKKLNILLRWSLIQLFGALTIFTLVFAPALFAIDNPEQVLPEIGIHTVLGKRIDSSLRLINSSGVGVTVSEVLKSGKPSIIVPVYYQCPRLCGLVLKGVTQLLNKLDLKLGESYQVLTISFDPEEKAELALQRQQEYRNQYTGSGNSEGWLFFVGALDQIEALMEQLGFSYKKDGAEFVHASAIMILTPQGEISQYFTGIEYSAFDVKLALVEASQGKIGSAIDHLMLFCFRFDPAKGKYTWAAFNVMRVAAILSMLGLFGLVGWLYYSERRKRESSSL